MRGTGKSVADDHEVGRGGLIEGQKAISRVLGHCATSSPSLEQKMIPNSGNLYFKRFSSVETGDMEMSHKNNWFVCSNTSTNWKVLAHLS
jgi:hypothetical protein